MKNLEVKKQIKSIRLSVKRNVEISDTDKMILTTELKELETLNSINVYTYFFNMFMQPLLVAKGVKFTAKNYKEKHGYGFSEMTAVNI